MKVVKLVEAEAVTTAFANSVLVDLVVAKDGSVESVKVLKGNKAHFESAAAAAKQWRFSPFLQRGVPVRVIVEMSVFVEERSRESLPGAVAMDRLTACISLVNARKALEAESSCRKAVDVANDALGKATAEQWLGHAILAQGRPDEALLHYTRGLNIATTVMGSDDSELAGAYRNVAMAYAVSGQWTTADEFYSRAVSTFEAAIRARPSMASRYTSGLRSALTDHAKVKRALGDETAAAALEAKASQLKGERDEQTACHAHTPDGRRT
jgi:tetratricopeptide (TPR) repeat protein